ncbi:stage V sporulation protein AB [Lacrimispora aerotolerans]|uniref:stage V sporulation protein AB n=1 Tax=Lacrimispora aerotolerans TaxID=36832 RepID=UPI00047B4E98|nr:stage V sporulation protein AB [Lacrimispora aerotolerans]
MISLNEVFLCLIGLSAGGIIAAGVFAFLVMIGIFPRIISATKTSNHIILFETCIILGGITGNVMDLYKFPIGYGGNLVLGIYGLSVGVFIGCLVMSLAETLKALPIFCRRINLGVGLQYIILSIGIGKLLGSLVFFAERFGK